MFSKLLYANCDVIKELSKDGTELSIKYVLYKKDGTEVLIGKKVTKVADIDAKIAVLQGEKAVITNLTKSGGSMDIKTMKGEEIATLISGEYQKLMMANQNIQALQAELKRREGEKKEEEPKGE
jgi:uncharacterized small protein (DUF1192 family)